jgi:tRNA pseudouridine38-40 synthase
MQFIGTRYAGWQHQRNALSVQQVVEEALSELTNEPIKATGCSRTDAGVHAEDFIVNFQTKSTIPTDRFAPALQSRLPRDIAIVSSREVKSDFNARRNSYEKTYRYQIAGSRSPFYNDFWWQTDQTLDFGVLASCSRLISGCHDFSGFCVTRSLKNDNHCNIKQATWKRTGKRLYFKITGDRFLHHMVRFLVGAQYQAACGKISVDSFRRMEKVKYR